MNQREYWANHNRVHRILGSATVHQCVRCPRQAQEWAQIHTEDGTDPLTDYVPMCVSCHRLYDSINRTERWYVTRAEAGARFAALNKARTGQALLPRHRAQVMAAAGIVPKLTAEIVRECRDRALQGERNRDLAIEYGVREGTMSQAINRVTWRWVQ